MSIRFNIQFNNVNTVWASVLAETLARLGLKTAVICPGSRSAALAVAFAQNPGIEAVPVLDERSAAFWALGLARQGRSAVLVCTSGSAGAHFYPAVIEAYESRMPLLILTADRPPELRDCNAGQTVDQQKLYGSFSSFYSELALPALDRLPYLRQTLIHAWERLHYPVGSVVHLNLPFRDPLAPVSQPDVEQFAAQFPADFFEAIAPAAWPAVALNPAIAPIQPPSERGLIIAGLAQPDAPQAYSTAVARLAEALQVPVLAEGLSPLRNYADLNPSLISTYDLMLRDPELADKLAPDWVIRLGEMPTSKQLRQWLSQIQPRQWIIESTDRNLDPLHGKTTHLRGSVEQFAQQFTQQFAQPDNWPVAPLSPYLDLWLTQEAKYRAALDQQLATLPAQPQLFEGKAAWILSQYLPEHTPLYVASSTPTRDVEFFWRPGNRAIRPYFNRGANGIDGTLSTALGMAHRNQSSVLLTGDLALLHDTNGFLIGRRLVGHLTIVLINNQGGGIFESLPIAAFDPPFEEFFATPQSINFAQLCQTYGVEYELIGSWDQLIQQISVLPAQGLRLLELQTDRKQDAQTRRMLLTSAVLPNNQP
ncbi:MAG: 2-succinyl-5-enolpyruvyl-6-hydroxy-3-cyclohexene-1-carboxylic-acid synthase [Pegethrix bostrychoides GSE-TBD4-15B]|jgi:2-succinyl-5-enolpyruvyl-6-hydroxy-3-cyclohexene-1-carboxylate synthase|uniref:2-succinyl-5-enolpyruvyl-6-hydroxy-3-cyclohexene-1-carboxylate synthase n=1 Tax=Pegethrix bostrychoides GSE-TBD4-15B TaxID=2839662 RepID=A0A951PCA8_9CYAN|nr:2-succinyl-5-enolpyruvyl-6-hydroxy-3-cyclohexene-1-carboxylic-acid synthase [Pegethrix bostrychoides GSE-TBD4-15B]